MGDEMFQVGRIEKDGTVVYAIGIDPVFCEVHTTYPCLGVCSSNDLPNYEQARHDETKADYREC